MGLLDAFMQDQPQPSGGLLGQGFADPRSAAIMALAGGLMRGDAGGGFMGASNAFQSALNGQVDRLAKTQQIGINNIQLQQAMQKWKWLQDAMASADQPPQTQGAPNPNAPQIALAQGADVQPSLNLPDGSRLNTGGIGPTSANAQRAGLVAPIQIPAQSNNPYVAAGNALGITPRAAIMQSMMFPDAFNKAYGAALTPTDLQRTDKYLGLTPEQTRSTELAKRFKEGYVAPTRLGQGAYNDPYLGVQGLPSAPQPGFQNLRNPDGSWSTVPIGNGPQSVQVSAQANALGKAAGAAPYESPVSVPLSDGRSLTLSKPEYAAYQQTGQLPARYSSLQPGGSSTPPSAIPQLDGNPDAASTPYQRSVSDIASIQREIANVNRSTAPQSTKTMQLGILNQELAKATAAASAATASAPAAVPQPSPTTAAPMVGVTPTLGTAPSQAAPSDQMKSDYATMASAGPQAQQSLEYLDHLIELANKKPFYMGVGIGGLPGVDRVSTDAAEYEKARASYISAQGKALGSAGTDAARSTIEQAVPEYGKPQDAMIRGLTDQRNQLVTGMLRRQVLAPVYQAGNEKAYTELSNGFDQNIKPSMVPVLSLPSSAKRAAIKAAIEKDPSLRPSYEWAFNHGLAQ
jgi:hypothetical protein